MLSKVGKDGRLVGMKEEWFECAGQFDEDIQAKINDHVKAMIMNSRMVRTLVFNGAPDSEVLIFLNLMIDQLNLALPDDLGIWAIIALIERADVDWHPIPVKRDSE